LQLVLATLPVGVGVTDRMGDIVLVNAASKRIWGDVIVSGRERRAQSKGFWHDSGKRIAPTEWASVRAVSEGQTSLNELIDIETFDGHRKTIQNSAAPVRNAEGLIVGTVVVNEDVTDRVQAEEALRRSEEHLRLVINTIPVMAWSTRPDGIVDFLNQRWLEYAGLSFEEYVQDPTGPVHPEDVPRIMEKWLAVMATGEPYEEEMRLRRADGQYRWFLVRTEPLRDEHGNLAKWYGVSTDIEELKRADAALKESQLRLEEAQRIAHVGHWDRDMETGRITWSDEIYRILGLSLQERDSLRTEWLDVVHPDDRPRLSLAIEEMQRGTRRFDVEFRIVRPNGEVRFLHSQGDVIRDERGRPLRRFGTAQDITERKQAEEKLKATSEQLRALSASLQSAKEEEGTRIAREIHDELGSRLTSLKWDLEGLNRSLSNSARQAQLPELRKKVEAMIELTDATIDTIRRISSELRPSILDDLGLVAAIEWQAKEFQTRTGIVCTCDCSLENVGLNREQSTAVFRIFQEALTNVLRHARATKVDTKTEEVDGQFVLTVSDNGRGITETEKLGVTSLGLLGMKERARLVSGEVEISRNKKGGTIITVQLPIAREGGG
jgi:PAS domain S-box-containing protein